MIEWQAALAGSLGTFASALSRVLSDEVLRNHLAKGALEGPRWFTWDATARRALEALVEEAADRN